MAVSILTEVHILYLSVMSSLVLVLVLAAARIYYVAIRRLPTGWKIACASLLTLAALTGSWMVVAGTILTLGVASRHLSRYLSEKAAEHQARLAQARGALIREHLGAATEPAQVEVLIIDQFAEMMALAGNANAQAVVDGRVRAVSVTCTDPDQADPIQTDATLFGSANPARERSVSPESPSWGE